MSLQETDAPDIFCGNVPPMKFVYLTFLLLFSPLALFAKDLQIKVVSVHDGDTLTAIGVEDQQKYKVRLMGVDTPEVDFFQKSQGEVALKARDFLRDLAPEGSLLTVIDGDSQVDKHGRILGRLLRNNIDINKEMLKNGWGALYFIYPFDKRVVSDYVKAAKEAYDNRLGIFSNDYKGTMMPYLFRLSVKKQQGINPVGDFELKKILSPDNIEAIPVWKRVFFPNYDMAHANGYN